MSVEVVLSRVVNYVYIEYTLFRLHCLLVFKLLIPPLRHNRNILSSPAIFLMCFVKFLKFPIATRQL